MNESEQVSVSKIKFDPAPKKYLQHHKTSRHYFVIENGVMCSIDCDLMEKAWHGETQWNGPDGELRILTAIYDEAEKIVGCYFLLVSIVNGRFDAESIEEANHASMQQALQISVGKGPLLLPNYLRQTSGWPGDWPRQVATALDVDARFVYDGGIGGPLLSSFTTHMSIIKSMQMHVESQRRQLEIKPRRFVFF